MTEQKPPSESNEENDDFLIRATVDVNPGVKKVLSSLCSLGAAAFDAGTARLRLSRARKDALIQDITEKGRVTLEERTMKRLVEEQQRIDGVVLEAIERLRDASKLDLPGATKEEENRKEIDDDWLETFRAEAIKRSQSEMREAFVRILAGEIESPGRVSIKTVRTLGMLSQTTANIFRKAASLRVGLDQVSLHGNKIRRQMADAFLPSLGEQLGQNSLAEYGLSYANLAVLVEDNLLLPEIALYCNKDYRAAVLQTDDPRLVGLNPFPRYPTIRSYFVHQNRDWILIPQPGFDRIGKEYRIDGVSFSQVGKELLSIVEIEPNPKYQKKVEDFFVTQNLKMVPIE